ncbi:hypothetical protein H072_4064 [Dactylellina haptotyla CBS 200.50]|uniref:Pentacotripeptide-repeat region of PRORP domain-containing protein n=1 Tax=Dactylellina haptotyla (strain CBS 200.50) TaxID=1284197 RepID=S8AG00_DACHA|nr:hypothetical protein H072_4064 [Dactylellina haptotyla CBS 200.50]
MLIARRQFTTAPRGGRNAVRRPTKVFPSPPSTATDKRGKFLTRGGSKSVEERRWSASRTRESVETRDDDYRQGGRQMALLNSKEMRVRDGKKKIDPAKIAATVLKALDGTEGEHNDAVDLLRELASRHGRTDLVVAWNHVIEWKLKRGNITAAMKIYNEMKKRGTKPDSYTYLRILNGLADNAAKSPSALGQALTVFYSMTAPSSTVKPSIIHTNAVLKVCAQAKDVDAMWDIAERIPDRGRGQADALTYTTLLNGIRNSIDGSPDRAITEGRELWENVLLKWQDGTVPMDEGLGCAMARLLLRSAKPEDWDEVLSLCQDVFGVPRLIPRIGTKARTLLPIKNFAGSGKKKEVDQEKEAENAEAMTMNLNDSISAAIKSVGGAGVDDEQATEANAEAEEEPELGLTMSHADSTTALITSQIPIEKPPLGNNALSLILETCLSLRAYDTARNYWDLITDSYNVTPDRDNYNNRMRVLSMQSDSAGCLALVEEMIKKNVALGQNLFFIALNGCRRANKITGFNDAYRLLDLMHNHGVEVTSKCIIAFIRTATVTEDVEVMKRAWMRLNPGLFNIHKLIDPTNKSIDKISKDLESCQELVSLSDAILSRMYKNKLDETEKEFADHVTGARGKIHKYINEYFNKNNKGKSETPALMSQVSSHRFSQKMDKEHPMPKLTVSRDAIGRWQKFGTNDIQQTRPVFQKKEALGPGEVSLEGMTFRPKSNKLVDALKIRGDAPRSKRFLRNKDTDFTAHYRPRKEKKRMDKEREYQ